MGERSKLSPGQLAEIGARNQAHFEREVKLLLPAARKALFGYLAALRRRMDQSAFGLAAPQPALIAAGYDNGGPLSPGARAVTNDTGAPVLVAAGPIAQPAGPEQHGFTQADAQTLQTVFESAAPEWDAVMQNTLMPGIKAMLGRIPLPADDQAVITAAGAWRSEWLTERTQELKGVPDGIASQIRTELDRLATENGTNVFEAKNAVRSLLAPERMDWEAQRIARTEVVMANNSSMLASWRALVGGMGGGLSARKTWIGGQRPTHSAVSGTTIGINEKFQVGDSEMDGPGDPAGGPSECCNCSCSLGFELDDSAPNLSTGDGEDPAGDLGDAGDSEAAADTGAEPEPGGDPGSFDYAAAADEDLSRMLSDAGETGDETAMNRILDELDRRDAATRMAEDAKTGTSLDPAEAEKDARYTQLINEGVDAERAFADAYGGKVEQNKVKEKIQALRAAGYQGKGWHQLTQAVFKEEADRMYWLAQSMDETKGVMLNKAGKQAGIDAKSLFTGPESRARKYASDELLGFWAKYTRITVEDVRAGILGGAMRSAATAAWI